MRSAHRPLIPDVIPVLGIYDEAILLPAFILPAVWPIPPALMDEHRVEAARSGKLPLGRAGAALLVLLRIAVAALVASCLRPSRGGEG